MLFIFRSIAVHALNCYQHLLITCNPPPPTHTHTTPLPMIFGLLILKMRGLIKPNNDNEFLHVNVKEHLLKIYYINLLN